MSNENTPSEPEQQDSGTAPSESADSETPAPESDAPTAETAASETTTTESDPVESTAVESTAAESTGETGVEQDEESDEAADMSDEPETAVDEAADTAHAGSSDYVPPRPPPAPVAPPVRRLVRDPYTRLGGVASGVAHHYGIDVSLVRIAFIVFTLFSGVGLLLYLLAWLIIPRAEYWPPAPPPEGRSLSSAIQGRELGYGLLAVGILLAIFAGGGDAARMLVSVGLVGAGIWMLVQPNSSPSGEPVTEGAAAPTPVGASATSTTTAAAAAPGASTAPVTPSAQTAPMAQAAYPTQTAPAADATEQVPSSWQPAAADDAASVSGADDTMASGPAGSSRPAVAGAGGSEGPPVYTTTQPAYVPQPVPPRRRRLWPLFLLLAILALPVLFVAGVVGLAIASEEGLNIDIDADNVVELTPLTLEDLPASIDEGAGEIVIDLTELDTSLLDDADLPQSVDIDLNAGEVTVEVPDDLPVNVDASVGAGDITVFDDHRDGIRPRISVTENDAVVDLDIRVGVGEVTVDR